MKRHLIATLLTLIAFAVTAQESPRVLFIGNSYTEVNNLPQMVLNIAHNMGDDMTYSSNTPGGCTFSQHCVNYSMQLICQGGWDVVVLQEQSQLPSFPQGQVEGEVFPYAERLVDSIYAHNPCAEPMFYMTWGRRDGDQINAQYFPVLGTYEGMDSMLCLRYTYMAETYDASLCPVGRVWRYLRANHPDINLYASDGSHPSQAGTYAAACAFYTLIFHRDPAAITFNASLEASVASTIRSAVHDVVFNNLPQWQRPLPEVEIQLLDANDSNLVWIGCTPQRADSLNWYFGDSTDYTTNADSNTIIHHTFADSGIYTITLVASRHCITDTAIITVHVSGITPGPFTLNVYSDNYSMGYVSGSGTYIYFSDVNISANANSGYHFVQWNDGDTNYNRTVTLISDTTFTAFFAPNQYRLTLQCNDTSFGSVSGGGEYNYLDTVTIFATATEDYHFVYWIDSTYVYNEWGYGHYQINYNTDNPRQVVVTGDATYTAYFESTTQGIAGVDENDIRVFALDGLIHVRVDGIDVGDFCVYDLMGREVFHATHADDLPTLHGGVYLVKVGTLPARKVVVIR